MTITAAIAGCWSTAWIHTMAKIITAYQRFQFGIEHALQKRHLRQRVFNRFIDADQLFDVVADGYRLLNLLPFRI